MLLPVRAGENRKLPGAVGTGLVANEPSGVHSNKQLAGAVPAGPETGRGPIGWPTMKQPLVERVVRWMRASLDPDRLLPPALRLMLFPVLILGLALGLLGLLAVFHLRGPVKARPSVEEVARLLEYHRRLPPGVYPAARDAVPSVPLTISTVPEGAAVFADSTYIGVTPVSGYLAPPGLLSLSFDKSDYARKDTVLMIEGEVSQVLTFALSPLAGAPGAVRWSDRAPDPGGGLESWNALFVDRAQTASLSARRPEAARTDKPASEKTRPAGAKPASRPKTRAAVPASADVRVSSDPPGATVWLSGRAYGQTPTTIRGLKPGSYEFTLHKKGYDPYVTVVAVRPGSLRGVHGHLKSQKARIGWR